MPSDSMNIGVTGIDAYQAQIDVISNNIANVGTVAYKGQSLSFQDLLYQTQQPGSGPTATSGGINYQQIGIGVKVGGTDTDATQGGVQTTGVTTNMMINGDGYFILKNVDGTGTPKYTRDGDFSLSSGGTLFDSTSGQAVMGYSANPAGVIQPGMGAIQVPIGLKAQATATGQGLKAGPTGDKVFDMSYGGNLNSGNYATAVAAAATAAAAPAVAATAAALASAASVTDSTLASTSIAAVGTDLASVSTSYGGTIATDISTAVTDLRLSNTAALAYANGTGTAAAATMAATVSAAASATVSADLATSSANATAAASLVGATAASVATAAGYTIMPGATTTVSQELAYVTSAATTFTFDSTAAGTASSAAVNATSNALALGTISTQTAANTSATTIAAAFATSATTNAATAGTTIYDSLGAPHLMNVTFTAANLAAMPMNVNNAAGVATEAATAWTYTLTSTDGTLFSNGTTTSTPQYAFYDQGGQFINTSGTSSPSPTSVHTAGSAPSAAAGNGLSITQWGSPAGSDNSAKAVAPPPAGPIGIDLSALTAQSASATLASTGQNGYAPGTLSNMTVGTDGTITGSYTNGESTTLGRVALATFQNEAGLLRTGSNDYLESVDSGQAQIGTADSGRFGTITGNALELSNVSIGDQFTKLIVAQNAFTANSKSITTANEDDQTVIGLIH
jgi:flagellar hook protein FlgE